MRRGLGPSIGRDKFGVAYRLRVAHAAQGLLRKDIFHIPYEAREKVSAQRFSVLGVPILYLGRTLYVCWEELGCPDFQSLWIAAFRLREGKSVRLLNLAYRPGLMANVLEDTGYPRSRTQLERIAASYCVLWPLIAASSFQVPNPGSPFIVEYVVPQMLMSWVAENEEFDGIRFFSSVHALPPAASFAIFNYALPAQDIRPAGYSQRLADLFEFTEPVPWSYLDVVGTLTEPVYHGRVHAVLKLGEAVPYGRTKFGTMEARLDQLEFMSL